MSEIGAMWLIAAPDLWVLLIIPALLVTFWLAAIVVYRISCWWFRIFSSPLAVAAIRRSRQP